MNFFLKIFSNKSLIYFRKLILHFSLKISGYKNFGNFHETGEEYFLDQIYKDNIRNGLDIGAHIDAFQENY